MDGVNPLAAEKKRRKNQHAPPRLRTRTPLPPVAGVLSEVEVLGAPLLPFPAMVELDVGDGAGALREHAIDRCDDFVGRVVAQALDCGGVDGVDGSHVLSVLRSRSRA